jgi:hypothetical protein
LRARWLSRLGLGEGGSRHSADLIGQGTLTSGRGVKVDQRGALGVLPHPGHEFFGVRARIGSELVAGVPQVVEVDAFQTDSG